MVVFCKGVTGVVIVDPPNMAAVMAGGFSPVTFPVSFTANNPQKPTSIRFLPQSFGPICAATTNPSLSVKRLRFARPTAIGSKRASRSLPVSWSAVSNSESNTEGDSTNSNSDASIDIKLPRRRLLVQFTCNSCGERTERLVNPLAYKRGLVFVQCAGCLQHHKLVDNLGLIVEYDFRDSAKDSSTDHV